MKKKIAIIGSGFSGLSAACYLSQAGHEVHVYEKNSSVGGRARQLKTECGYTFDMGPSWYWMPDILDNFFEDFGFETNHFYELISLNPQFEMVFQNTTLVVPEKYADLKILFEKIEKGAGKRLEKFMQNAKFKYEVGMQNFVQKPCKSWFEFMHITIAKSVLKLNLFTNFRKYVKKYFTHPHLITLMEFPVIFLGAAPQKIPALYSLMNYGGYALGTHYPKGGFFKIVEAMEKIAKQHGVKFYFNHAIQRIKTENNKATSIEINNQEIKFDYVVSTADYAHTESLLKEKEKNYTQKYWQTRTFAPSCLIYYIGINEKIPNLLHHTLFFENELDEHVNEIYNTKKWPSKPLFYACCTSKTDESTAPENHENLFLLMPIANGLQDIETTREKYFLQMIKRLEKHTGSNNLLSKIVYKKSYCVNDFIQDYNAYGGNAYGLANTLLQTAVLKPSIQNKKIKNLYYAGQLTVPGPGVPPSIISGKIIANEIINQNKYEVYF